MYICILTNIFCYITTPTNKIQNIILKSSLVISFFSSPAYSESISELCLPTRAEGEFVLLFVSKKCMLQFHLSRINKDT